MANTYTDYTAGSNETSFSYSFTVLLESHVAVEINGQPITYNTDFTVNKATSVVTLQLGGIAGAGATAGDIVRVRRKSNPSTDLVDFADGSRLSSSRLDLAYQHNRFLNEEASEISDGAISEVTAGGSTFLDAQSREVKNLPAPTTGGSATNKTYVDAQDATTLSSAQAHANSGDSTLQSNLTAGDSATLSSAQSHANSGDSTTLASANAYTDSRTALTSTNLTSFANDEFTGDGTTTTFTFVNITPQVSDPEAFTLTVDGLTQSPYNYTINKTAGQLVMSAAPPSGAKICVVTNAGASTINFPASFSGDDVTFDGTLQADRRINVEGKEDNNNHIVAGIQVNQNLVAGEQGYAFIDLHGDSTNANQYTRLLNDKGTFYLQNKKAGNSIFLETTNNSGNKVTGLKVDADQNVIVENGNIVGSGAVKITRNSTVYPNNHAGGLLQLANNTSASAIKLSLDPNEILASDGLTIRSAYNKQLVLGQNNAAASQTVARLIVQSDGKVKTPNQTISDITDTKQVTTKEYVDAQVATVTQQVTTLTQQGEASAIRTAAFRVGGSTHYKNFVDIPLTMTGSSDFMSISNGDTINLTSGSYRLSYRLEHKSQGNHINGFEHKLNVTSGSFAPFSLPVFTDGTASTSYREYAPIDRQFIVTSGMSFKFQARNANASSNAYFHDLRNVCVSVQKVI